MAVWSSSARGAPILRCPLRDCAEVTRWRDALADIGVVEMGQLIERLERTPDALAELVGSAKEDIDVAIRPWRDQADRALEGIRLTNVRPMPTGGILGSWRHERDGEPEVFSAEQPFNLRNELGQMNLPPSVSLIDEHPPVEDQGPYGFCTGFPTAAARTRLARSGISAGYCYRGAKSRDGYPHIEGSFQSYVLEHTWETGAALSRDYSYQDAIDDRPIDPLEQQGLVQPYRIDAYVDLLPENDEDYDLVVPLIKASLAGMLNPEIGPHPVMISLLLYESFDDWSTRTTGLVTIPLPGEHLCGGHALLAVGYVDSMTAEQLGLAATDYVIVRNSWGEDWANDNFLGPEYAGHCLIPAGYFTAERTWELVVCLAEPPPISLSRLLSRLFRKDAAGATSFFQDCQHEK